MKKLSDFAQLCRMESSAVFEEFFVGEHLRHTLLGTTTPTMAWRIITTDPSTASDASVPPWRSLHDADTLRDRRAYTSSCDSTRRLRCWVCLWSRHRFLQMYSTFD